jgi:hypothetical protein
LTFIHHFKKIKMTKWFSAGLIMAPLHLLPAIQLKMKLQQEPLLLQKKTGARLMANRFISIHLTNKNGDVVTISNYGGTVTSWTSPIRLATRAVSLLVLTV